jgi:uncharacterized protein with HEPN domain
MKSKHAGRVPQYLQHIVDAIDRATSYVKDMDMAGFEADTRTQDAVIRSIEIVGEAANKTRVADPDFAARHPHVPWDVMYGMRNPIVHDYFAGRGSESNAHRLPKLTNPSVVSASVSGEPSPADRFGRPGAALPTTMPPTGPLQSASNAAPRPSGRPGVFELVHQPSSANALSVGI